MNRIDIERVREAVDLVALISEFVPLVPKGREWIGVCPFHDDHKPSLNVVTHKTNSFYKCFSCGASGDCIAFVRNYHKKDFGEALRYLADKVGIELSQLSHSDEGTSSRRKLRNAMEWSAKLYREALTNTPDGAFALETLHRRGFTDASIATFSLGVAPDAWGFLSDRVRNNQDQTTTCVEAGLMKKKEGGARVYDTFRHRLMFPICDETGSPVAFGGRRLIEEVEPKYINSPETALFHKSKTLYGYHLARPAIQTANKAIIVEGYTDVIACHQVGIKNVVATLGTALTPDHAAKLARICDEVILVFDGDDAGQRAADRAVEVFFSKAIDVQICVLPEGKDPASLLEDVDTLQSCFDDSIDAIAFKLNRLEESLHETGTISGRAKRIEAFLDELVRLGIDKIAGVRKPLVYERIAALMKITIEEVESHMHSRRSRPVSAFSHTQVEAVPIQQEVHMSRALRLAEHEFLAVLLFDPTEASAALREEKDQIFPEHFMDPYAAMIAEHILPRLKTGTPYSMQELLSELNEASSSLASSLYFKGQRISNENESVMQAVHVTKKTFLNAIQDKAIANEVRNLKTVSDPKEREHAAQQALETIRRQKLSRTAL